MEKKRMHGDSIQYTVYSIQYSTHARNTKKGPRYFILLIERVWYIASHELTHSIPHPGSQLLRIFPQKGITSRRPCLLFSGLFQASLSAQPTPLREGSPWVGPINAALKRLELATVTPDGTSTLSAPSASLSLCRFSDAFSSSLTHAAINLQSPSHTVLYQNSRV